MLMHTIFHFSERPSVGSDYAVEIKAYQKEEKHMLTKSLERMYDRECNVSPYCEVCVNLTSMCTVNPLVQVYPD
jgi:hypothetical protein